MRRLLTWLNRMPCRCTRYADRGMSGVDVTCRRHAFLWWLTDHYILRMEDGDYFHNGWIEWRPWRWTRSASVAEWKENHPDQRWIFG